ncbi:serine hydrolase [Rhodococcus baikonurensis]|jgi:hypothetical protein|uniref:serine hydrolase n=1 Tax=Rhodococcus baikonurensis TaxID=172041 RepID=UPI0037A485B2
MQLVESGAVALDESVQSYLPDFEVDDPRTAKITVRELLNQTSGISDETLREKSLPQPHSLQAAEQRARVATLAEEPGTRHPYTNTGVGGRGEIRGDGRRVRRQRNMTVGGAPLFESSPGRSSPQLVRLVASEFAVDEIGCGRSLMLGTRTHVSRKSCHTSSSHQYFDSAVSHRNTVTKGEFSVSSAGTVGAMRGGMNLDDQLRKPGMSQ